MARSRLTVVVTTAAMLLMAGGAEAAPQHPPNTIDGALERSPLRQGQAAAGGPVGDGRLEKRLAAQFRARGVRHFKPSMVRDIALAEIETGTPAGVLASISEREFSHNTVMVNGSIPGTVSSRGYYTAFAFKPSSWDYYKDQVWGNDSDLHDPFDYGDAAIICGTILQHYREPGRPESNRMEVDPLGSLRDYNANYAAGVLEDAETKYASPLWDKLIADLSQPATVAPPKKTTKKKGKLTADERLLLRLRAHVLGFLREAAAVAGVAPRPN